MIGWMIPIVGALAYWIASEQTPSSPGEVLAWSPEDGGAARSLRVGFDDPLPWHVAAAMVTPLAYSYGELREIVTILDHRGEHAAADRLALLVLAMVPHQRLMVAHGHLGALHWFNGSPARFSGGVPPYPPPPVAPW